MQTIDILKREKERITKSLNHTNSQIIEYNEELLRLQQVKEDYEKTINNLNETISTLEV